MTKPTTGKPTTKRTRKQKIASILAVLVVLGLAAGVFAWYQVFREVPQPESITGDPRENFLYGSIGAEAEAGIPYLLIVVLPRVFPEHLPGPGGYASLGLPWRRGASSRSASRRRRSASSASASTAPSATPPATAPARTSRPPSSPPAAATRPTSRACSSSSARRRPTRAGTATS